MAPESNVIPIPGIARPTVPPESGEALVAPQLDSWGKVAFSVTKGIAAAADSGGPKGTNWLAGFIVAVGLIMTAVTGWMGVQLQDMRNSIDDMRTEQVALVQAQAARDDIQNDAIFALHDNQRTMDKWTQRIMLDMWRKLNPDREPPTPPDTDSDDRVFLNLR